MVFGHEFLGVVSEVAHDVDDVQVGDRVVVEPLMVDGTCWACQQVIQLCVSKWVSSVFPAGAVLWPSPSWLKNRWLHPFGDMALQEGALFEPLAVALKAKGLNVILSEVSAARQQIAKDAGYADRIVDPTEESLLNVVSEATDGVGAAWPLIVPV